MSSWFVDVKCKEKFKDPKSVASLSYPMMDDFDYTSDIKYIENIEDFIERFAVHYVVLNVDLYNELLLLVKVADDKYQFSVYAHNCALACTGLGTTSNRKIKANMM